MVFTTPTDVAHCPWAEASGTSGWSPWGWQGQGGQGLSGLACRSPDGTGDPKLAGRAQGR
jgi:hypothetical protein